MHIYCILLLIIILICILFSLLCIPRKHISIIIIIIQINVRSRLFLFIGKAKSRQRAIEESRSFDSYSKHAARGVCCHGRFAGISVERCKRYTSKTKLFVTAERRIPPVRTASVFVYLHTTMCILLCVQYIYNNIIMSVGRVSHEKKHCVLDKRKCLWNE